MRKLLNIGLLCGCFYGYAQTFTVKGQVVECYNDMYDKNEKDPEHTVYIIDYYNHETEETKADQLGNFEFRNKVKGKWTIRISGTSNFLYQTPDTVINLDSDVNDLKICLDKLFRPIGQVKQDSMRLMAKTDIQKGEIKLYTFTPWSISGDKDPLQKTNKKANKYGLKVLLISCSRLESRGEVEDYFAYKIYNREIAQYLDIKFGEAWRRRIKYNSKD